MTTRQVVEWIRDALLADADVEAYCQTNWTRSLTVMVGLDEKGPPEVDVYPICVIARVEEQRADNAREQEWKVILEVGVENPEIVTSGQLIEYTGFLQAQDLRELCEAALYKARIATVGSGGESASETYGELFLSVTTITVRALRSTQRALP